MESAIGEPIKVGRGAVMTGAKKSNLYIIIFIIIQTGICIVAGTYKKSLFCDEIYSYGLANSEAYTFIDPETAQQYSSTGWVDDEYFKGYIEVDERNRLSFRAAFENQEKDVHPPLYYCLLHLVCWLFRGSFSKWTGIGMNILILFLTDLIFLFIAEYLYQDMKESVFAMMLWSCSAAGLSNILFIRMYLLLTYEILAFAALHIWWMKKSRTGLKIRDYAALLLLTAAGGLTHYYFYLFVFFFSGVICIYLLFCRRIGEMLKYGFTLVGGGLLAVAVFPGTVAHIFEGYRGTEVWGNLSGREENVYAVYLKWVDQSIFGGCFWLLILALIIIAVWKGINRYFFRFRLEKDRLSQNLILHIQKTEKDSRGEYCMRLRPAVLFFLLMLFACTMFGVIAAKGSGLLSNRYIYPVYPVIAMGIVFMTVSGIRQMSGRKQENKILLVIVLLLCILSVRVYGIDFLYSDYEIFESQAEQIRGSDCLLYYGDEWLDVYTALPLKLIYDETYFLHPNEVEDLSDLLSARETEDPVVVCLPDRWTQEEAEEVLGQIMDAGGFSEYRMVYHYYTQAYLVE